MLLRAKHFIYSTQNKSKMKKMNLNQMEQISGGNFNWGEFFTGVCQGATVATIFINPVGAVAYVLYGGSVVCNFA